MHRILTQTRIVLNKFRVWALVGLALTLAACTSAPTLPEVVQPTVPTLRTPSWGLALGGGAARGFAHIGVLQVLEENGLRPTVVTGTSAGSLVAAMYATGMKGSEIERLALGMEEATLTDWSLPILGRGVLRGDALER